LIEKDEVVKGVNYKVYSLQVTWKGRDIWLVECYG
jgi:hypothetical protein